MFISDHDKGLLEVDIVLGQHCIRAYYYKHLEGNLKDQFGSKGGLPALFQKAARARLPSGFEHHIAKIVVVNLATAQYLYSIVAKLWAVAYFPRTWHGYLTSNVAKSINKILREDRILSITELLDAKWHRVIAERAS